MAGRIYLLNDDNLVAMDEVPYDSELRLQTLLATHPDLLAGEQINSDDPRRWLLVTREMAVPGEDQGPAKWSLDHLFIDQDAVPTLVEVKRSQRLPYSEGSCRSDAGLRGQRRRVLADRTDSCAVRNALRGGRD